ncbi:hypothetical protein BJX70DRAFT_374385 [Aspergillus crustosus]
MRSYLFLLVAFLGAMALAAPMPTETAAVVRSVVVGKKDADVTPDEDDEDGLIVADGF